MICPLAKKFNPENHKIQDQMN